MRKDPRMHQYTDTKPDESIEDTELYIDKMLKGVDENNWIIWAIEHKASGKVIGSVSIWNINESLGTAELAYGITPDFQGRGLMKEALLQVMEYGFHTLHLTALDAYTEKGNLPSKKLLEGCKFTVMDEVDDPDTYSDKVYHMLVYRLENVL